jgi:hypothetical protein
LLKFAENAGIVVPLPRHLDDGYQYSKGRIERPAHGRGKDEQKMQYQYNRFAEHFVVTF